MNNQLAALKADAGRAPSAPVPALHDQFQLASLLGDARSADLGFGAKSDTLTTLTATTPKTLPSTTSRFKCHTTAGTPG